MPPILTLGLEVGLIFGLTVWERRKSGKTRRVLGEMALAGQELDSSPRGKNFEPGLAFLVFWLRCFCIAWGLCLLDLLSGWLRFSNWDVALNILGVMTTVAFVLGLACGIGLFTSWGQPIWQQFWGDFNRPRPNRHRRFQTENLAESELEPPLTEQNSVTIDLPPYYELKSPNANAELKWCDECGRWMGQQHRHNKVAV